MLLAILIISIAFRAETELHLRAVNLGPAADRTFVLGNARISAHIPLKLLPPVDLFRIQMHHIARSEKEHHEIEKGCANSKLPVHTGR